MKTIAEVIAEHQQHHETGRFPYCWGCSRAGIDTCFLTYNEFAAHVAQAIRESRTVRTVEELLALPHGTYILTAGGVFPNDEVPKAEWEAVLEDCAPLIPLPARVLWIAEEEQ